MRVIDIIASTVFGSVCVLCVPLGYANKWLRSCLLFGMVAVARCVAKKAALQQLLQSTDMYYQVALMDRNLKWPLMKLALDKGTKSTWGLPFVISMYWLQENFSDARDAAEYACVLTELESIERSGDAKNGFLYMRDMEKGLCLPTNFSDLLLPKQQVRSSRVEQDFRSWRSVVKYYRYREVHIARELLDWSKQHQDEPARRAILNASVSYTHFTRLPRLGFNGDLAKTMGMEATKFSQIKAQIEKMCFLGEAH